MEEIAIVSLIVAVFTLSDLLRGKQKSKLLGERLPEIKTNYALIASLIVFTFSFSQSKAGRDLISELLSSQTSSKPEVLTQQKIKQIKVDPEADAYKCFDECVSAKDFCSDSPKTCYDAFDSCNNTCCFKYEQYGTSATILCKNR